MLLDHLIATVPTIRAAHARLLGMGFEEAWPVGPFWPGALTSGIALGGANLELVQLDLGVAEARVDTLVLAPGSREGGEAMLRETGDEYTVRDKVEPNPRLLALRGFPPDLCATPQTICENLYPVNPPYPFFLCLYASFLKSRLAPANFAAPRGPLVGLSLVAPEPETVRHLFAGRLGPIELDVDFGERALVAMVHFADGSSLSQHDLQD